MKERLARWLNWLTAKYVAKRLIELHCGRIWVESEPSEGSTFTFALPADRTA